MSTPIVRLQAHLGNVSSLSVDSSSDGGRYLATAGVDGMVKVWDCRNWKGVVREWRVRSGGNGKNGGAGAEVDWSGKGFLAVAAGGAVNVRLLLFHQCYSTSLTTLS
jgi:U3 small nucleolar RNA-associated protein 7